MRYFKRFIVIGSAVAAVAIIAFLGLFGELLRAKGSDSTSYRYFVADSNGEGSRPLLLYLHPAGRQNLLRIRAEALLLSVFDRPLNAIVVTPLSPDGQRSWSVSRLEVLLDELEVAYDTDGSVFIVGFSMGGFGAWAMAERLSHRVSAIVPVAGGAPHSGSICGDRPVPVWAIHGIEDEVVPPSASVGLVEEFRACGADTRLTLLPGVGHKYRAYTLAKLRVFDWLATHGV